MDNNLQKHHRGGWGTNFGFLMAAIGSAVGLGNIWGFPYKMGANGGFAFLLVYLALVLFVGLAVMLGELALGRRTGLGAVGTYAKLAKKYTWVGYMGVASGFFILAFYSVLGGMVLRYCLGYLIGMFGGNGWGEHGLGYFLGILSEPGTMLIFYAIFMVINIVIVMGGIKGGIEKFSSIAMPALAAILVVVIIYVAFQPGAGAGYAFMFKPDFSLLATDFFGVLRSAAGQMFFSLSLGMGCMITYGSYLDKKENLQRNAIIIPVADTIMAIMAGLAVMPACAAFGVEFGAGPGLLFSSMQTVFHNMGGFIGNLMGFLFYFLVLIAALTSSISLLEVCTAFAIDKRMEKGKDPARKKMTCIFATIIFVVGIPVALDTLGTATGLVPTPRVLLGLTESTQGWNASWLDFYDMLSEGVMMPLGAMFMSILIGWKFMPTWKNRDRAMLLVQECEEGGRKFWGYTFFEACFKFIVPIGMVIVLWGQLLAFFG